MKHSARIGFAAIIATSSLALAACGVQQAVPANVTGPLSAPSSDAPTQTPVPVTPISANDGATPTPAAPTPTVTASATPTPTVTATGTPTVSAPAVQTPTPKPTPTTPAIDCSKLKCVALTYDDGPTANTRTLMSKLQQAKAPATFFFIGKNAEMYPNTVSKAHAAGFVIGNHTYDHEPMASLSLSQQKSEVSRGKAALENADAGTVTLLRPPYGSMNSSTTSVGAPIVTWDVDTLDWQTHDGAQTLATIKKDTRPGSIILMHDTQMSSINQTQAIVSWLRSQGYTLVTVPQMIGQGKPGTVYHGYKR